MAKQGINPFRGAPIPKSRIQSAISRSLSMKAAARELNVSYNTFKKYAKMYDLFEANVGGKGVYRDTGNFGAKIGIFDPDTIAEIGVQKIINKTIKKNFPRHSYLVEEESIKNISK